MLFVDLQVLETHHPKPFCQSQPSTMSGVNGKFGRSRLLAENTKVYRSGLAVKRNSDWKQDLGSDIVKCIYT